ncbi:MAG TPA: hypothetical protein VGJ30_02765 [Candidatus Angelobacter sp.]|jgi:hypothetical protein
MIYIKSIVAGLLAVMLAYLLVFVIGISVLIIANVPSKEQDSVIGFDIVAFGRSLLAISIGVLAFIAGFVWEYLRVSRV